MDVRQPAAKYGNKKPRAGEHRGIILRIATISTGTLRQGKHIPSAKRADCDPG